MKISSLYPVVPYKRVPYKQTLLYNALVSVQGEGAGPGLDGGADQEEHAQAAADRREGEHSGTGETHTVRLEL